MLEDARLGTLVVEDEMTGTSYEITCVKLDELHPAVTVTAILERCPIVDRHTTAVLDLHVVASHAENPRFAASDGLLMENASQVMV